MTDRLAEVLGVRPGDTVRIELLEGDGRTRDMTVAGLVHEPMGLGVYMDAAALDDFRASTASSTARRCAPMGVIRRRCTTRCGQCRTWPACS